MGQNIRQKHRFKQLLVAGLSLVMIAGALDLSMLTATAQTMEPEVMLTAADNAEGSPTVSGSAIVEHIHHWSYEGVGNSNLMRCTCDSTVGTCPFEHNEAWFLLKQGIFVYDGLEHEVRVEVSVREKGMTRDVYVDPQTIGITLPDIVYVENDMGSPTGIPIAGKPVDVGHYLGYLTIEGARARAEIKIEKAIPVVKSQVIPSAITYGEALNDSELRNGIMQRSETDQTEVPGTFTWKEPDVRPTAVDSETLEYDILFTPVDQVNYASVELKSKLIVHKAVNAPYMPGTVKNVANSVTRVGDITLPADWAWTASDQDMELEVGVVKNATAEYTGADKGNYQNEQVKVQVTRSACEHIASEVLYTGSGERAPTCTVDGLGHKECMRCGKVIDTGIVVKAAHRFSTDWTIDVAATTTAEGSKSHHCMDCSEKTDITVIPKVTISGGGSGSGGAGGGAVTPVKPEQPSGTQEGDIPVKNEDGTGQTDTAPAKLGLRAGRTTTTTQKLTWKEVSGADGYEIYAAPRNTEKKTYRLKLQRTVRRTKTGYTLRGLKSGTAYRYVIKAYRIIDGEKVYITGSKTIYATTKKNK